MNWYKKAVRKIYVPANDYDKLMILVDKMAKGNRVWSMEDLEIQQTYPDALEVLLKEKTHSNNCQTGTCPL